MSGCLPPLLYSSELAGRVTAKGAAATGLLGRNSGSGRDVDIDSCGIAAVFLIRITFASLPALGVSMNIFRIRLFAAKLRRGTLSSANPGVI